jgi:hypothetical protein
MNQLPNLPRSPLQIENQYKQGLVTLGYDRKNLPPLWVYNLYEALKPNGKKLNDSSIPYFQDIQQGMQDAIDDIKAQRLVGSNGKQMTVKEYMEMVYGKKNKSNSYQIPPLSPSIQALKNLPKPIVEPTSLDDKLAELKKNMPAPNPSSQPGLFYGNSSPLHVSLDDLKAAYLAQNPPSQKPASSPSPYRGPSRH